MYFCDAETMFDKSSSLRVAYVGSFAFPADDARAQRVSGVALALQHIGCDVLIGAGGSDGTTKQCFDVQKLPFSITALNEYPQSIERLAKLIRIFTWGGNTLSWLSNLVPQPNAVLLYGGGTAYIRKILPWCKEKRVPLLVDVVEWYQPSHVPGGWLGPFHWDHELALRFYYPQASGIVAISRYLEHYFNNRGCRTLRMPPTLDVKNTSARLTVEKGPITLAYAGFPGKKDLVGNVISALLQIDPEGKRMRFIIAGPNQETILRLPQLAAFKSSGLPSCIKAVGLLSHQQVVQLVRDSDFVPLLRPPLRYAQAGFPTKIPESLALGTPVICNLTSDLGDYIHNDTEGIICQDYSVAACAAALERVLSLTIEQRVEMRKAARAQAEQSFDYRLYAGVLANFLKEVQSCA